MRRNPNRNPAERARGALRDAVNRGDVIPAKSCEACGADDRKCSDGRRYLQAHHHRGHEHPLDVQWLCAKCHRKETPLPIGERNGTARLTCDAVVAASKMVQSGETLTRVAAHFKVDRRTIARAVKGQTWLAARKGGVS